MPEGRENTGKAILKLDHGSKENKLFIDIISIKTHNNSESVVKITNLLLRKIELREVK